MDKQEQMSVKCTEKLVDEINQVKTSVEDDMSKTVSSIKATNNEINQVKTSVDDLGADLMDKQ